MVQLSLQDKLLLMKNGMKTVFRKPQYVVVAAVSALLFNGIVVWLLNTALLRYILFAAPLTVFEKTSFLWDVQVGLLHLDGQLVSLMALLVAILFGLNSAVLVYIIRHARRHQLPKKSGGASILFALLAGGCIACGTSLLAPLFVALGATGAALSRDANVYLNISSSLLFLYSLFRLSLLVPHKRT